MRTINEITGQLSGLFSPGVTLIDDLENAGKKILRFQLGQMLNWQSIALLGEDIEGVHKMRVATRRIRTLFRYLKPYFKQKKFRAYRAFIANTGRVLGGVRDLDVIRLVLGEFGLEDIEAWRAAYDLDYARKRAALNKLVQSPEYSQNISGFYQFLTETKWKHKKTSPIKVGDPKTYFPQMLLGKWQSIQKKYVDITPEPYSTLHRLRIDLKRLRYLIEFFGDITNPETSQESILAIIALQDHLGHLNDVYNAGQLLSGMQKGYSKMQKAVQPKLDELIKIQVNEAHRFIPIWREFQTGRINDLLPTILD